ncbi:unnamed protein product [Rotaria sp. Silwood1]|nr:unnamed protein product [Rotaria sp. Silwood1]
MTTESRISNRFLDADKEPLRALTPIEGYEKKPLVSLEEAVQPLRNLLHNLDNMVSTAKWNTREPSDSLTPDESAAIHLYTMQWQKPHPSLYTLLNETLRSEQRIDLIPWFLYLKLFLTALYKLPSIKDTIWRGIRGDVNNQYKTDQIWWGISSCTDTMEVMERFVGRSGVRTLFNIEAVNGKAIKAHSHFPRENEILLMPGTYFKVRGKWSPAENLFIIQLKETEAPWQTIAPPNQPNLPANPCTINNATILKTSESVKYTTSATSIVPLGSTNISVHTRWSQNGVTVAGGNQQGDRFNQLNHPCGLFVDHNENIYIVDRYNHRVVKWKFGETSGQVIAGGNGQGSRYDQLSLPTDVIVDINTDSLIICDAENRRVVRSPCQDGTHGETIVSNIDCFGLTVDDNGFLYISDDIKNEVTRWRIGDTHGEVVAGGKGKGNNFDQFNLPLGSTNISVHTRWSQNGVTVAGGNQQGDRFNQLNHPCGLFVDHNENIYIVDRYNHRVVKWKFGETSGQVIAGGNGQGSGYDQLSLPTDVIVDINTDSLIICDAENRRVVRWPCQDGIHGETIISNIDCFGLTMDDNGFLYISDDIKNEVTRWRIGDTHGEVVAGGNGKGNNFDQFNRPTYIFIDKDYSLYVSDHINRRIMKWMKGATEGIEIAASCGFENDPSQLSRPRGLIVDQLGTIYVADFENHRIMRWLKGNKQGNIIVGGNGKGREPNQLDGPNGLSFDQQGNLYVVDCDNNRVQKFDIDLSFSS